MSEDLILRNEATELSTERQQQNRGMETGLDKEDKTVPRLKIMQNMSPEVLDKLADEGDLLNSLTKQNYGREFKFVPIKYFKSRIMWKERKLGGGMECSARDGKTGNAYGDCSICDNKNWHDVEPPKCTPIINLISFIANAKTKRLDVVCISFLKTSYVTGKNLINILDYKKKDIFNFAYTLSSKATKNDMGSFYVLEYRDSNHIVPDDVYAKAQAVFESLKDKDVEVDNKEEVVPF